MVNGRQPLPGIPEFGPLRGLRIVDSGRNNAGPWAASLAGDFGAEVIHVEPLEGEIYRFDRNAWAQEKRNQYDLTVNLREPEGKKIFLELLETADIWIESSIPGTYERLDLRDDVVRKRNPKLIIIHVSGYGQTGDPRYVPRASYDMIGQAFGGLMQLQGLPDPNPPIAAKPYLCDYITGLYSLWSALAAYIHAQRTGEGQSIDVAQFETVFRMLADTSINYFENDVVPERRGNRHPLAVPWDTYRSKDGAWFCINAAADPFERLCEAIGEDPKDSRWSPQFEKCLSGMPGAEAFEKVLKKWMSEHTAEEVEQILTEKHRVPCQRALTIREMAEDPHYAARSDFIEWEDKVLGKVRGAGFVPKFSKTPGRFWKAAPGLGESNELVLKSLGYSEEAIAELRNKNIIGESY